MKDVGNVWCPWEVGHVKTRHAGSIPVTSVKVLHSGGNFFCKFDRIMEDYSKTIKQRIMNLVRFITIAMILTSVKGDEDYPIEEIVFDVGAGMAVAACEKNEECSSLMSTITMLAVVLALVSWCLCPGDDDYGEYNDMKSWKRGGAMGAGYMIGRQIF